jgi:phosphotriesterase-related protein
MTVTGPMDAAELGVIDAHDHLLMSSPAMRGQELDDVERTIDEVRAARGSGIRSIVELTPIGLGRRPELLRRVSATAGLPIIAATGFHRDVHYPSGHWALEAPVDLLAERVTRDLLEGMHPRDWEGNAPLDAARAGVIKTGASYHHISAAERRRLVAAAIGSRASGAAIVVHAEIGTCGHEIVALLEGEGVPTHRVVLAHMDRNPDAELHAELAARGVTLVYDTVGRIKYRPDSALLDLIAEMVAVGHGERLLVGLDLGSREYFAAYGGGPGIRYLMDTFVPRLRRRIGEAATDAILVANPARTYALRPQ